MTTDLVTTPHRSLAINTTSGLEGAFKIADALARSGLFKDARQAAQAFAKIVAGDELGIGPVAAMQGFHVVDGRLSPGATLIAAMVRRSGRIRYAVEESTDEACRLRWHELVHGEWTPVGTSGFSMEDARRAGLAGRGPWKTYPSDMLFARALTRGARRFCPEVFAGQGIYTPEELGADVDAEGDPVVDDPAVWEQRWASAVDMVGEQTARDLMRGNNPRLLDMDAAWERLQHLIEVEDARRASESTDGVASVTPTGEGPEGEPTGVDESSKPSTPVNQPEPDVDTRPVTPGQLRRLFAAATECGLEEDESRPIMLHVAKVESRKDIPRWAMDPIIEALVEAGRAKTEAKHAAAATPRGYATPEEVAS